MSDIFKSPASMLRQAKRHLANLEARIDSFVKDKAWSPVIEDDADGTSKIVKIKFTERLADDLPNIIFDCANNLRSTLDQIAFAIGVKHTGLSNPKYAKFPFGPTEADMRNNLAGRCKDLPAEVRGLFAAFQPYKGGNDALWGMNELCNAPKHKMIYPLAMAGGAAKVTGRAAVARPVELMEDGRWDSEKNELVFARITDPDSVRGYLNFKLAFTVAFDEVDEVIRGKHPVETLRAMTGEVERVLVTTKGECRRIGLIE